jgi:anaerobic ribonucleoside-triphosphate reductase activating protein
MGTTTVEEVLAALAPWQAEADGLTVSGGEPFEQGEALAALLAGWSASSPGDVLVFTGFERAAVEPWLAAHPGLIDALVTGPFRQDAPQTLALRGSDNQELHVLTPRGTPFLAFERTVGPDDRRLDAMFDADGAVWFAGIPARDDFRRLRGALEAAGHTVALSLQSRGTA